MKAVQHSAEAIIDASPDCIKILSPDGRLKYVNERGLKLMDAASLDVVLDSYYPDMWPVDMRARVADAIKNAAGGAVTHVEGFCPTLKGTPRWWETHFRRLAADDDKGPAVIGVSRDISERRAQDLTVKSTDARFALLVQFASDGICESDAEGRCKFINPAGARMLGYEPHELIGQLLHPLIHHHRADGSEYPEAECPIRLSALTGGSAHVSGEVFWHKEGHQVPTRYSIYPQGGAGGVVLTFNDDTEHERAQETLRKTAGELMETKRRTTEFIATLAHELRNPLAPIRTGLQIMRKAGNDQAVLGDVREMMERQVGQMVHLIGDLLDIARVTSGKIDLKKARLELHDVVRSAVEACGALFVRSGHLLEVELPAEPIFIDGDATRLIQVFTNILDNAAKYTARGGSISITATPMDDEVVVHITDTGMGIARESLNEVFEMFTQIGRGVSTDRGGLGIGLNLVRKLVELHGGRVVADSEGPGKGSRFRVTLPLSKRPDGCLDGSPNTATARPHSQPIKILVVDDNVDAATSLSMLLELSHHVLKIAHSGAEALATLREFKPDVVLLDIGMPGMNGYEVARAIRKMPDAGNPALVALTGWGGEADRLLSKNAGFDQHLTKPADIAVIEKMLSDLDSNER